MISSASNPKLSRFEYVQINNNEPPGTYRLPPMPLRLSRASSTYLPTYLPLLLYAPKGSATAYIHLRDLPAAA